MRSPVDMYSPFATGLQGKLRSAIIGGVAKTGFRLERLEDTANFIEDGSTLTPTLMADAVSIPGMVSLRRGMYYYWLAYAGISGNIIELGCWQGRSTSFLARACRDTGNGVVHAVDTFQGNPGKELAYLAGEKNLSNMQTLFTSHMQRLGLAEHVRVHVGRSVDLSEKVLEQAGAPRMLVVDAEHTYEAVSRELAAYADGLQVGGLLVLDDYSKSFEGVAAAVNEHIAKTGRYARPAQDRNLLVTRRIR